MKCDAVLKPYEARLVQQSLERWLVLEPRQVVPADMGPAAIQRPLESGESAVGPALDRPDSSRIGVKPVRHLSTPVGDPKNRFGLAKDSFGFGIATARP